MKKTANNWLLLMMMFCASFAFFSCSSSDSDEDEDLDNVSGIIGTWKEDDEFNGYGETYLQFKKDGTFYEIDIYEDGEVEVDKAKWESVGSNKVRVSGGIGPTVIIEVLSVSKKELVIDFFVELRYKKVSDSAIDKYIK